MAFSKYFPGRESNAGIRKMVLASKGMKIEKDRWIKRNEPASTIVAAWFDLHRTFRQRVQTSIG